MEPSSNWLYLEDERYNRIGKSGVEINFHFTNEIGELEIKIEGQLTPRFGQSSTAVFQSRASATLLHRAASDW